MQPVSGIHKILEIVICRCHGHNVEMKSQLNVTLAETCIVTSTPLTIPKIRPGIHLWHMKLLYRACKASAFFGWKVSLGV